MRRNSEDHIQISSYVLKSNFAQLNFSLPHLKEKAETSVVASADRKGCLLKLTDPVGNWGVADLHPWPEWDGLMQEQLLTMIKEFPETRWNDTLKNAFLRAKKDREARQKNRSFWNEIPRPMTAQQKIRVKNNYLIVESLARVPEMELQGRLRQAEENGFDIIKVKMGWNIKTEKEVLFELMREFPHFLWRLDFNSVCNFSEAKDFFSDWTRDQIRAVEYVEDPCVFDVGHWQQLNQMIPLALDRPKGSHWLDPQELPEGVAVKAFKYLVLKPAHQNIQPWVDWCKDKKIRVTMTSSMDHPMGIAHSMMEYLDIQKKYPQLLSVPGFRSSFAFEKNNFSVELEDETPFLSAAQGIGVGFDESLRKISWTDFT